MTTNEALMMHNLTCNSTDVQRRCIGPIEFRSPSYASIEREAMPNDSNVIRNDAEDCAGKLNLLLLAKEASATAGIHRANACAGTRVASAIRYHCHGETLESIGKRLGKDKQVIGRYHQRFVSWSALHCAPLAETHTPETVIDTCKKRASLTYPLADVLDDFRQQLTDIVHDLLETAERLGQQEIEVYRSAAQFEKTKTHPVNVVELMGIN